MGGLLEGGAHDDKLKRGDLGLPGLGQAPPERHNPREHPEEQVAVEAALVGLVEHDHAAAEQHRREFSTGSKGRGRVGMGSKSSEKERSRRKGNAE